MEERISRPSIPGIDFVGLSVSFWCYDQLTRKFALHWRINGRDSRNVWDSGGGQIHSGESVEDALMRETEEEYGCTGKLLELLTPYSLLRNENGIQSHWFVCPGIIAVDPSQVRLMEPEKHTQLTWFHLNNFPSYEQLHPGLQYVLDNYQKVLEKYK